MANKFKLDKISKAVDNAIKESIFIAGKDALAQFKKSFVDEGFTDDHLEKWKPRQRQIRGSLGAGLSRNHPNTKKTLTKTGALKRSIRIGFRTATSVRLISNLPYSAIHNEGLRGMAWGKHSFKMPKRKFMGNSKNLEKRTFAKMTAKINTAIRNA